MGACGGDRDSYGRAGWIVPSLRNKGRPDLGEGGGQIWEARSLTMLATGVDE